MAEKKLSHVGEDNHPQMVDVGQKSASHRVAIAETSVFLTSEIMDLVKEGELQSKKGPVFQSAILAGIMAAKKTGELIPLCHPLGLDNCKINISIAGKNHLKIQCEASLHAKTGVEMEALVGASIAALTIYDMCKALSHDIIIKETKLISKRGGKSDFKR